MIVQLSTRAKAEFNSALAFLLEESERAAEDLRQRIEAAVDSLKDLPNRGRPGHMAGTRELLVRKTPYVVVYLVEDQIVRVIRIRHTRQDPAP